MWGTISSFAEIVKKMDYTGIVGCWAWLIPSKCLLNSFASIAWILALESTILCLPDVAFLDHMVTILWSNAPSPFVEQMILVVAIMLGFSLNLKTTSSWIRLLHIHLCSFPITHIVKQSITCQLPRYYQPQLELLWSCDVYTINLHIPKYSKTFDSHK